MAEISITFINAGDDSEIDVDISNDMTREEIIHNLIEADFLPQLNSQDRDYSLTVKGKGEVGEGQTLSQVGAVDGDVVRIAVVQRGGQ